MVDENVCLVPECGGRGWRRTVPTPEFPSNWVQCRACKGSGSRGVHMPEGMTREGRIMHDVTMRPPAKPRPPELFALPGGKS